MRKKRSVLHWSGGKDCAYTLYILNQQSNITVDRILVSLNGKNKISMHGVDKSLIECQAEMIGTPVEFVTLPENPSNKEYEETLLAEMETCRNDGIEYAAFGDIFLTDVRKYRENLFRQADFKTLFPLWGMNTRKLAEEFIDSGFKAKVVSVNGSKLDSSFAGRDYDHKFIDNLPKSTDSCGENGEFHTFVYDGPIFKEPLKIDVGNTIRKLIQSPSDPQEHIRFYYSGISLKK
jgi:uncharacterized protein (TIGR00290 family)